MARISEATGGATATVLRKRWDSRRLGYVACYSCSKCLRTFVRDFHDRYPVKCPKCGRKFYRIRGEIGRKS